MSDPNRNQTDVAFDTLGLVVGTTVMGKPDMIPGEGDSPAGFVADLTQAQLDAFFDAPDPRASAPELLQGAILRVVYDLDRFCRSVQANPDDSSQWQPPCAATRSEDPAQLFYSDGFGREIQAESGSLGEGGPHAVRRWVGSGWTIFYNKGKPVRRYEPFFSPTHQFQFGVTIGVSPVLFYDPVGRVVAAVNPNHTYEKVVFGPWQQITYDAMEDGITACPSMVACTARSSTPATNARGSTELAPARIARTHARLMPPDRLR